MGLREVFGHLMNHAAAQEAKPMPAQAPIPATAPMPAQAVPPQQMPPPNAVMPAKPQEKPTFMHQLGVGLQNVHKGSDEAYDFMAKSPNNAAMGGGWAAQPQLYSGLAQAMQR